MKIFDKVCLLINVNVLKNKLNLFVKSKRLLIILKYKFECENSTISNLIFKLFFGLIKFDYISA